MATAVSMFIPLGTNPVAYKPVTLNSADLTLYSDEFMQNMIKEAAQRLADSVDEYVAEMIMNGKV